MQRVLKVLSCLLLVIFVLVQKPEVSAASSILVPWSSSTVQAGTTKSIEVALIHPKKWFEKSSKHEQHFLGKKEPHSVENVNRLSKEKDIIVNGKLFEIVNGRPQLGRVQVEIDPSLLKNSLNSSLKVVGGLAGLGITADLAKGLYKSYLDYKAEVERSGRSLDPCEPVLIRLADSDTVYKIYDPKSCIHQSNQR